jgi:hypothetical protein
MTFSLGKFFPKPPINEPSLQLSDAKWKELEGGYKGEIYDASAALKQLEQAETLEAANLVYQELWNELHHQGDVGLASYYALPHLVRIAKQTHLVDHNVLSLVTVIELQRPKNNPKLPKALSAEYYAAIRDLEELAKISMKQDWDLGSAVSALSAIALAKNQVKLANLILNLDSEEEIDELLKNY